MIDESVGGVTSGSDSTASTAAPTPAPTNTQSAPLPLTAPPATPARPLTPMAPPVAPPKPGEFMHNLSQAFVGGLLGTLAGRQKTTGYTTNSEGVQTADVAPKTSGDQIRDVARAALLGLGAGASAEVQNQRSGLAKGLAGIGAGATDAVDRAKERDLLLRKQSTEEYERGQQATLVKAQNAHIMIQTAGLAQDLYNKNFETQEKVAAIGKDQYDAMVEVGNAAPVSDLHKDDLLKWKNDHPEYMKWTPLLTKVLPKEGAQPDPRTGQFAPEDVDRYYSLVDLTKDVPLTQTMVDHLNAVHFPGADALKVGQTVPASQYAALWHQGLVHYNQEENDPKNVDVITGTGPNGLPIMEAYNKSTKSLQVLKNEKGEPLVGKLPDRSGVDELFNKVKPDGTRQYANTTNGYLQATRDYKAAEQQGEIEGSSFKLGNARIPIGYQPPADSFHMNEGDLRTTLQTKGVQLPENFSTLYAVGHYKADPGDFTKSLRRGVPQMSEADAVGLIRNLVNPGYDQAKWEQVKELKKGFANTTPSAAGGQLIAFNTAAAHLGDLYTAAAALKNGPNSLKALNEIAQRYGVETNQPAPAVFGAIRAAVSREVGKTFEGGAVDVGTAKDIQENINRAQSTDVIQDVARTNARLMVDKAASLVDAYHGITEEWPENSTNLTAVSALDKMGIDSSRIGGHAPRSQSGQTGQGGTEIPGLPPNAIPGRDANGNIVGYSLNNKYVALPQPIAAQGGR